MVKHNPERRLCPCRGCSERRVDRDYNCHSHCDAFKAWQDAYKAAQERTTDERAARVDMIERSIRMNDKKRKVKKGWY